MLQAGWEYIARPWLLMYGSTGRFVFLLIFEGANQAITVHYKDYCVSHFVWRTTRLT